MTITITYESETLIIFNHKTDSIYEENVFIYTCFLYKLLLDLQYFMPPVTHKTNIEFNCL